MSANDHLRPEQLRMFMPANEIYEEYPTVDAMGDQYLSWRENELAMRDKLRVANKDYGYGSLRESVAKRGVERPVRLSRTDGGEPPPEWAGGWLGNGGHRVAVQNDLDPDRLVPVIHDDDFNDSRMPTSSYSEDFQGWGAKRVREQHGHDR